MSLIRWLAAALCAATFLAVDNPAGAARATTPVARSTTIVSGPAGTSTLLRLTATARLNNAGGDVTFDAGGSRATGLLLVRADGNGQYANTDFYDEAYATDLGLCGHSPCPVPLPARAWAYGNPQDSGQPLALRPGTYLAVLLGEPGNRMKATIHFGAQPAGRLALATSGPSRATMTVASPTLTAAGRDVQARGYHVDYSTHRMFVGELGMFGVGSPGFVNIGACSNAASGPPPTQATPCSAGATVQYEYPSVVPNVGGTAYTTSAALGYGPPNGYSEFGYDVVMASSGIQWIRWASYRVVLPW